MANPPIIIGPFNNVPAPGSPIRSDWPQQISTYVTRIHESDVDAAVTITGPTDAAAAGFTNWLVTGVTVPTWASRARIVTTVSGVFSPTGTAYGSIFELQTALGVNAGIVTHWSPPAANVKQVLTWSDAVAVTSGGALNLAVLARRTWGSDVMRVDVGAACRFNVQFDF